ncbi:hypothetical protein MNBD_ALPHA06-601 [hydrothermal vent metagenome]|uniref:Glutathione S-transferase n=1 Tax=hydrothermal vent metagenome TaxID=652676 RepID=A0A3B0SIF4_9ZZZZ
MLQMNPLQAAGLYLAIQLILMLVLAYRVVQKRMDGIGLGDGDDITMQRRIRIHGNLTEYAPLFLLGLFALASLGASVVVIHSFGIVFTVARCGHAFNFHNEDGKKPQGRFFGTLFTWLSMLFLALTLLYFVFLG